MPLLTPTQFFGNFGRRHNGARRAIAYPATIEQAQRIGDHRRLGDRFLAQPPPQMGFGIFDSILVTLPGDVRHRLLELFHRHIVARRIGAFQPGKGSGRCRARLPEFVERALGPFRQSAISGILELLDANGQRDIRRARRHRIDSTTQRFGSRGAQIFNPGDGNLGQAKTVGKRQSRLAEILLLHAQAKPSSVNIIAVDPRIPGRFFESLDQQIFGAAIPSLTKAGTAHSNDDNFVADSLGHQASPDRSTGTAFQK